MTADNRTPMPSSVRHGVGELEDFPTLLTWGFILTATGAALAAFFLSTAETTARGIDLSIWFWVGALTTVIGIILAAIGLSRLLWGLHRAMAETIYRREGSSRQHSGATHRE
jgi:hypothetical protein